MHNHQIFMQYSYKNKYGIPDFPAQKFKKLPDNIMPYSFRENRKYPSLVHFFIDDDKFEVVWNRPSVSLHAFQDGNAWAVCSPDFSMYSDFPEALLIYQVWRSRVLARYWSDNGLRVIPTVMFAGKKSLEYSFTGLPKNQVLAMSIPLCMSSKELSFFKAGYNEMKKELKPSMLVCFGEMINAIDDDVKKVFFPKGHFKIKKFRSNNE